MSAAPVTPTSPAPAPATAKAPVPTAFDAAVAIIAFGLGATIFIGLVVVVHFATVAPAIDADAGAKRSAALANLRGLEQTNLTTVGWVDEPRGIVRLPINLAIQTMIEEWQDPAKGHADLIAREKKATAPLPAAPAKPSAFE